MTVGRIVAVLHVTLDGVMQAPARPDEDPRDDFRYGGWATPYGDAVMASTVGPGMSSGGPGDGGLLLGRRTYEDFHRVWPQRKENPFTERLNSAQKYVASNTLSPALPWENSTLLCGDVLRAVAHLKATMSGNLVVLGSGALLQSLMQRHLVDEFLLTIYPLVLGTGRRLFPPEGPRLPLRLAETKPTTTGVISPVTRSLKFLTGDHPLSSPPPIPMIRRSTSIGADRSSRGWEEWSWGRPTEAPVMPITAP
jgi:dihydrofolate reductase